MKLLLADDQTEFRQSLRDLLQSEDSMEVVGEASDGAEAIQRALELRPDIVLMDIRMPGVDGIAATAAIRKEWPQALILVLTTFDEDDLIHRAMRAGAAGYVLKGVPLEDLLAIFRLATRGYVAVARGARTTSEEQDALEQRAGALSEREKQIWSLIGEGRTNRDIAERLFLTEGTVRNYITTVLATLQVRHRTEAALLWRRFSNSI